MSGVDSITRRTVVAALPLLGFVAPALADEPESPPLPAVTADPLPVSVAKDGFPPAQAAEYLKRFSNAEAVKAGDVALFGNTNFPSIQKITVIPRDGPVRMLETASDPGLGKVRVNSNLGEMSLADYLADPRSRAQGIVAVQQGRVVFEEYPGMRPNDYHLWMSTTKPLAGLMIHLLVEDGKIDLARSIADYLPELGGTEWNEVKVSDAVDMKTGMDVVENARTQQDSDSIFTRVNLAVLGAPHKGKVETTVEVLRSAKRLRPPGQAFDYASAVTLLLPMIVENVTQRRWGEQFGERVWSKMTVEGDLLIAVNPEGLAQAQGFAIGRLRDLARFGMLYTPSWDKAARERLVSEAHVRDIQTGGDPSIYYEGDLGEAMVKYFAGGRPRANRWQWDAVFEDGDFYKSGFMGQGLYVSPAKDTVVAFFGSNLAAYARATTKAL